MSHTHHPLPNPKSDLPSSESPAQAVDTLIPPMRLLLLEERPVYGGGSERITLSLGRLARQRGHHCEFVHRLDGAMLGAYREAGIATRRTAVQPIAIRRPFSAVRSVLALYLAVLRCRPDWIVTSQVSYTTLLACVGGLTRCRTAVHLGLVYDYESPLFRIARQRISVGIAPSVHCAQGWRQRGWPKDRLEVIPNGVETAVFRPSIEAHDDLYRLGMDGMSRPLIAYVGRLVASKGIFTLMRGFALWWRAAKQGRLLLMGDPAANEAAQLRELAAQLELPERAWSLRPASSNPEVAYRASDIVVVPSECDEAFGLVPLEAMASGSLTIVSDRGILADFVAPVGRNCVFSAGDAAGLAERLRFWTLHPSARTEAAALLCQHAHANFGFERCGDAYLRLFHNRRKRGL